MSAPKPPPKTPKLPEGLLKVISGHPYIVARLLCDVVREEAPRP